MKFKGLGSSIYICIYLCGDKQSIVYNRKIMQIKK
jgi:hypothetical protein